MMEIELSYQVACDFAHLPTDFEVKRWLTAALSAHCQEAHLTLRAVTEDEIFQLNHQYRQKSKPTNVLTFATQLPKALRGAYLGDVVICPTIIEQEAKAQGKSLEAHFAHMIVHSALHLLGFDHQTPKEANEMEALETQILAELDYPAPYGEQCIHE